MEARIGNRTPESTDLKKFEIFGLDPIEFWALKFFMTERNAAGEFLVPQGLLKNWQSIHNAQNAELVAVASRDVAKSQDFIDRCSARFPMQMIP